MNMNKPYLVVPNDIVQNETLSLEEKNELIARINLSNTRILWATITELDDIRECISTLDNCEVADTLLAVLRADDLEDFEKIQEELAREVININDELIAEAAEEY